MSTSANNPRVATESNFENGSKESAVSGEDFRNVTRTSAEGAREQEFTGTPVRGESDVAWVCGSLREALQRDGIEIDGRFRVLEDGSDADALAVTVLGAEIRVQVTGIIRQDTQSELGRDRKSVSTKDESHLVSEIIEAIERKAAPDSYPAAQRLALTLALDACRSPAHSESSVVESVRASPRMDSLRNEFNAIWIVGPTAARTLRLDE